MKCMSFPQEGAVLNIWNFFNRRSSPVSRPYSDHTAHNKPGQHSPGDWETPPRAWHRCAASEPSCCLVVRAGSRGKGPEVAMLLVKLAVTGLLRMA